MNSDLSPIFSLKRRTLEEAEVHGLQVSDELSLVPVGQWILSSQHRDIISQLVQWRNLHREHFFYQDAVDVTGTRRYLVNESVGRSNRVLFLLFQDGLALGCMGLSNVQAGCGEVDNVIRGSENLHRPAMELALTSMVGWAFERLQLKNLTLRVRTENKRAKLFYGRCGFSHEGKVDRFGLCKCVPKNGCIFVKEGLVEDSPGLCADR